MIEVEFRECCYIYGYSSNVLEWIKNSLDFFSKIGLELKNVSYDKNYEKFERKSLDKFYSEFDLDNDLSVENLYSFTLFTGKSLKYPHSWIYGVSFDKPSRSLKIFFNKNIENNHEKNLELIERYLQDKIINFGHFSVESIWGSESSLNLYMEDNHSWWLACNPRNREILYNSSPKLKHIYPFNIINYALYNYEDASFCFKEWIKNPENGTLRKIGKENWLWNVPQDRLHEIGKFFYEKKLLLGVTGTSFDFI